MNNFSIREVASYLVRHNAIIATGVIINPFPMLLCNEGVIPELEQHWFRPHCRKNFAIKAHNQYVRNFGIGQFMYHKDDVVFSYDDTNALYVHSLAVMLEWMSNPVFMHDGVPYAVQLEPVTNRLFKVTLSNLHTAKRNLLTEHFYTFPNGFDPNTVVVTSIVIDTFVKDNGRHKGFYHRVDLVVPSTVFNQSLSFAKGTVDPDGKKLARYLSSITSRMFIGTNEIAVNEMDVDHMVALWLAVKASVFRTIGRMGYVEKNIIKAAQQDSGAGWFGRLGNAFCKLFHFDNDPDQDCDENLSKYMHKAGVTDVEKLKKTPMNIVKAVVDPCEWIHGIFKVVRFLYRMDVELNSDEFDFIGVHVPPKKITYRKNGMNYVADIQHVEREGVEQITALIQGKSIARRDAPSEGTVRVMLQALKQLGNPELETDEQVEAKVKAICLGALGEDAGISLQHCPETPGLEYVPVSGDGDCLLSAVAISSGHTVDALKKFLKIERTPICGWNIGELMNKIKNEMHIPVCVHHGDKGFCTRYGRGKYVHIIVYKHHAGALVSRSRLSGDVIAAPFSGQMDGGKSFEMQHRISEVISGLEKEELNVLFIGRPMVPVSFLTRWNIRKLVVLTSSDAEYSQCQQYYNAEKASYDVIVCSEVLPEKVRYDVIVINPASPLNSTGNGHILANLSLVYVDALAENGVLMYAYYCIEWLKENCGSDRYLYGPHEMPLPAVFSCKDELLMPTKAGPIALVSTGALLELGWAELYKDPQEAFRVAYLYQNDYTTDRLQGAEVAHPKLTPKTVLAEAKGLSSEE